VRAMRTLTCLAVVACLVGCEKSSSSDRVRIDPGLMYSVQARFNEVIAKPSVDKAFDLYFDGLFADPALVPVGEQLATSLASDPKVMGAATKFLEDMQKSSGMQRLVIDLMKANPRATPDEIGEMVGKHIEKTFSSPKLNASFQVIGTELIRRLDTHDALKPLGDRIDRAISDDYEVRWSKRIIELNGGSTPSPRVATQLILDHALEARRLEKFLLAVLTNKTVRGQSARLVARTLSLPSVAQELRAVVADLAQDPVVQQQVMELFDLLLANVPDVDAIAAKLREMLLSKRAVTDVGRFVRVVVANPDVAKLAGEFVDALAADKELRAAFDELMNGW
jgi:hypothetical protein